MDRIETTLEELQEEVIETRNVAIKTDHSLRNLVGEIRQLAQRHESSEKRAMLNSGVAYLLFAALCFAGLFLFFRSAIERAEVDRQLVDAEQRALQQQIRDLESDLERRRQSEREAYAFYELLAAHRQDEAVERWPTVQGRLQDRATTELFRREVDRIRHQLAREAFEAGQRGVANDQWEEARDAFARSIAYVEIAAYTPELHFLLAEALYNLSDFVGATRYYGMAIDGGTLTRPQLIIAMFRRAEALVRSDREVEGIDAYRLFARRFSDHSWANTARSRIQRYEARAQ
jgi:TolA-binding protein